jgi:TonB family protein
MCRRTLWLLITYMAALCVRSSYGQESPGLIALRQQLMASPMVLSDYSADPQRNYRYENGVLRSDLPFAHELALFDVKKVELNGTTLSIEGTQQFLFRVKTTREFSLGLSPRPVTLLVEIAGTNQDAALAQMRALLFAPTVPKAIDAVPTYVSSSVPAIWDTDTKSFDKCDPCGKGTANQYSETLMPSTREGMIPPRLIWQVIPKIPKEARKGALTAKVLVGLIVGTDGQPHELWLLHPAGYGLDEAAIKAVSQYKFQPAKHNGEPVPVSLNVEVNFQVR